MPNWQDEDPEGYATLDSRGEAHPMSGRINWVAVDEHLQAMLKRKELKTDFSKALAGEQIALTLYGKVTPLLMHVVRTTLRSTLSGRSQKNLLGTPWYVVSRSVQKAADVNGAGPTFQKAVRVQVYGMTRDPDLIRDALVKPWILDPVSKALENASMAIDEIKDQTPALVPYLEGVQRQLSSKALLMLGAGAESTE
jgi:hypothetical protein